MSEQHFGKAKKVAADLCKEDILQHTSALISAANEMQSRVSPSGAHGMPTGRVRNAQIELLKAVQLGMENGLLRVDIREAVMDVVRASDTSEEARAAVYQVLKTISPMK